MVWCIGHMALWNGLVAVLVGKWLKELHAGVVDLTCFPFYGRQLFLEVGVESMVVMKIGKDVFFMLSPEQRWWQEGRHCFCKLW